MDDDPGITHLFAEVADTSWTIAVHDRTDDVCIEVSHPTKHPDPTQFCGSLADVLAQVRQQIAEDR